METQGTYEYLCSYTVWNSELYRVQEDGIYCFLFRGDSYTDIGVCGLEIGEITLMTVEEAFAAAEVTGLPYGATVELGGNDSIFFDLGEEYTVGALLIAYGVCALLYKKKIVKGAIFAKLYPFIKN